MNTPNRRGKMLLITALTALLLVLAACGRKEQETSTDTAEATLTPQTESTVPQITSGESSAAVGTAVPDSSTENVPEEDPWAEGYFYDEALTAALWKRFATENTNDTDESRPTCTMTRDFLEELDSRAHAWLYDGISDSDTEHAMLALSFRFPGDAPDTERGMKSVRAGIYSFQGSDPDSLAARVRLGNTEACFYLFLRAYYSPAEDRTRIYMINGLVW